MWSYLSVRTLSSYPNELIGEFSRWPSNFITKTKTCNNLFNSIDAWYQKVPRYRRCGKFSNFIPTRAKVYLQIINRDEWKRQRETGVGGVPKDGARGCEWSCVLRQSAEWGLGRGGKNVSGRRLRRRLINRVGHIQPSDRRLITRVLLTERQTPATRLPTSEILVPAIVTYFGKWIIPCLRIRPCTGATRPTILLRLLGSQSQGPTRGPCPKVTVMMSIPRNLRKNSEYIFCAPT